MAEVIPFDQERRYIIQILEEQLVRAKAGEISSICVAYVKPDLRIGNHMYVSKSVGMALGTALMVAQNDYITEELRSCRPEDYTGMEPA